MRGLPVHHSSDTTMKTYYRQRAPIYDRVYSYPERQENLRYLEHHVTDLFTGKDVLEIAAGTGYWTQFIASKAKSVLATDYTVEALQQIKHRPNCESVTTRQLDAYSVSSLGRSYTGVYAGLWLSHVPKQTLNSFLAALHKVLFPGATVLFIDNSRAQCERLPISHTDSDGNSYQDRMLEDGSIHRVLKNFPSGEELHKLTKTLGTNPVHLELENYWLFQYQTL